MVDNFAYICPFTEHRECWGPREWRPFFMRSGPNLGGLSPCGVGMCGYGKYFYFDRNTRHVGMPGNLDPAGHDRSGDRHSKFQVMG